MMQSVVIWLILVGVAASLYWFVWRPRSQRLRLKIEPIPDKRLDNTPEPNEIIGAVRVRPREADRIQPVPETAESEVASIAVDTEPQPEPVKKPAAKKKSVKSDLPEILTPSPEPLSQDDLFPGEPVGPAVANQPRIYAIHVVANRSGFLGRELLGCLLQYGLRYGDMSIFHRHENPSGQGGVMFSLARAVEPGTFDIDDMEMQLIPGVTFFLQLPLPNSLVAFDLMVDTARRLATDLDGCVLDAGSQEISPEQLARWRYEIVQAEAP